MMGGRPSLVGACLLDGDVGGIAAMASHYACMPANASMAAASKPAQPVIPGGGLEGQMPKAWSAGDEGTPFVSA